MKYRKKISKVGDLNIGSEIPIMAAGAAGKVLWGNDSSLMKNLRKKKYKTRVSSSPNIIFHVSCLNL